MKIPACVLKDNSRLWLVWVLWCSVTAKILHFGSSLFDPVYLQVRERMPNVINFTFLEMLCYQHLRTVQMATGVANKDLVVTLQQHLWCEGTRTGKSTSVPVCRSPRECL